MALNADALKSEIISAMAKTSDPLTAHQAVADTVMQHILNNAELAGTYVGIIPGTPPVPDPNSGSHTWRPVSVMLVGAGLAAAAMGGIGAWQAILGLQLLTITFVGGSVVGTVMILPTLPIAFSMPLNIETNLQSSRPAEQDGAIQITADCIVQTLQSAVFPPASGVSAAGGAGPVTFGALN